MRIIDFKTQEPMTKSGHQVDGVMHLQSVLIYGKARGQFTKARNGLFVFIGDDVVLANMKGEISDKAQREKYGAIILVDNKPRQRRAFIEEHWGTQSRFAKELGVSDATVYRWYDHYPRRFLQHIEVLMDKSGKKADEIIALFT
jgi:hypothetical protein